MRSLPIHHQDPTAAAAKPHAGRKRVGVSMLVVVATLVATVGIASGNAANPYGASHGTITLNGATVTSNPDGSYTVTSGQAVVDVGGTWDWGTLAESSTQSTCATRYGVGWAVDWSGVSTQKAVNGSLGAWQIHGTNRFFHVFETDMDAVGNDDPFTSPCAEVDPQGFPMGPWSSQHTYASGSTIPASLCVNMYDLHGTPGKPKIADFNPAKNADNSVKTNAFDPTTNGGNCIAPTIQSDPIVVT